MTADIKSDVALPPEIIKYQAILSKDPGSMVFAPLAEAYRKIGMLDEAIATAREGNKRRPGYVSGMVALGRACFEKGMLVEARENLEKVLVIAPDNIIAAGILEELKKQQANNELQPEIQIDETPVGEVEVEEAPAEASLEETASNIIEGAEEAEPDEINVLEMEEIAELEEVEAEEILGDYQIDEISFEAQDSGLGLIKEENEAELEVVVEENPLLEEELPSWSEEPVERELFEQEHEEIEESGTRQRKEITTETIADLYIKQGYLDKAIDIYQTLYNAHPGNSAIKKKLEELKKKVVVKVEAVKEAKEERPVELDEDISTVASLESWLEVIQNKRRKG